MQARLASVPLSSSLAAFTTAYSLWRCMPRSTRDAVWEYSERASDWLDPFCYYTFPEKGEGSPNVWYKFVKAYFEHQRLQGNRCGVLLPMRRNDAGATKLVAGVQSLAA